MTNYLCIETCYDPFTFSIMFKKGEIYQTSFRSDHMSGSIYIQRKDIKCDRINYDYRFRKKIIGIYFIPLADWREQQIKSVLDD